MISDSLFQYLIVGICNCENLKFKAVVIYRIDCFILCLVYLASVKCINCLEVSFANIDNEHIDFTFSKLY